jgi:hypothetical protein
MGARPSRPKLNGEANVPNRRPGTRRRARRIRGIHDNVHKMLGFVPNYYRLMSISPNVLGGWAGVTGLLSDYCLAAHSYVSKDLAKIPPEEIALNRQGRSSDQKRQTAATFAKALIEMRGKVSDAQYAAVEDAG